MANDKLEYLPITFERGLNEFFEESMLPTGVAVQLRNWQPQPNGGLRVRVPWVQGTTTSAPATRKAVGVGYFSRLTSPGVIQFSEPVTGSVGGGGTIDLTPAWPSDTTKGNLLVFLFGLASSDGSTTVTGPTGWTSTGITNDTSSRPVVRIYYKANAASESGAETISVSGAAIGAAAFAQMVEITGVIASSPFDKGTDTSGTSGAVSSGNTAATTQAYEIDVAILATEFLADLANPTNSFIPLSDTQQVDATTDGSFRVFYRNASATGAQGVAVDAVGTHDWAGGIATFKSWYSSSTVTTQVREWLVAQNDTTEYDFYKLDRDSLAAGTWSTVSASITSSDPSSKLSMAPGLGRLWITNPALSSSYVYDGSTVAAVSGSPAGRGIAVHKNRVWVAGNNNTPGLIRYSNINDGTTWDTLDNVSVQRDTGEPIEDIVPFQDALYIATRTNVHVLTGSGVDTFSLSRLPVGGAAPGRPMVATPYGVVIAGREDVWLAGDTVTNISDAVSENYGLTGSFVATSYRNNIASILDVTSGTIWSLNLQTGTWYEERVDTAAERPAVIYNHDDLQVMGPSAATVGSLLNYRLIPGTDRGKDFSGVPETFLAKTPRIFPAGPEYLVTPRHLFLKVRQHGGNDSQTGITVTPIYQGTTGTPWTFEPRPTAGVYRDRMSLGEYKGITDIQFTFQQTVGSTESTAMDIEELTLAYVVEEVR